jgi:hypothetical protein
VIWAPLAFRPARMRLRPACRMARAAKWGRIWSSRVLMLRPGPLPARMLQVSPRSRQR